MGSLILTNAGVTSATALNATISSNNRHFNSASGERLSDTRQAIEDLEAKRLERRRAALLENSKPEKSNMKNEPGQDSIDKLAYQLDQWIKKMKTTGITGRTIDHMIAEGEIKVGVSELPVDKDTAISMEPYPVIDNAKCKYKGGRDKDGKMFGKGVVEYENGDIIAGMFKEGKRNGEFRITASVNGISSIMGDYVDDKIEGKAKIIFQDYSWMEGYFKQGVLHGFGRYFDEKGRLKEIANHRNGLKYGTCWKIFRGGGCVVGRANKEGDLTGHRIAYLYPDFKTALIGSFTDGVMESAQEAELKSIIDDNGVKVPLFTEPTGPEFKREIATFDKVTSDPLLRDPYESKMVEATTSKVPGANEGLYAKIKIEPNTTLAFYNGRRIKPKSKDDFDHPDWEKSAYKIFDPSRKNGTIDIPTEPINYRLLSNYCATLGHKTNHSFLPNAEFVVYDHPKYGVVPCLTSNHDIQPGEEIFVHYGYDLDGCPDWYEEAWQRGTYPVPDSLQEELQNWEESDYNRSTDCTRLKDFIPKDEKI